MKNGVKVGGVFHVVCIGPDGKIKWEDEAKNLVTNVGLQHLLDVLLGGGTPVSPWRVGLTSGTPTVAAADTLATHGGWTEVTNYTEGSRQEYVEVRSGQTMSNRASPANFSINGTVTIGGAFLASAASGTSGTLLCAAAFTGGNKSAGNGDTLQVTYTFTAADDGV
jgi:hypothetical protein